MNPFWCGFLFCCGRDSRWGGAVFVSTIQSEFIIKMYREQEATCIFTYIFMKGWAELCPVHLSKQPPHTLLLNIYIFLRLFLAPFVLSIHTLACKLCVCVFWSDHSLTPPDTLILSNQWLYHRSPPGATLNMRPAPLPMEEMEWRQTPPPITTAPGTFRLRRGSRFTWRKECLAVMERWAAH